MLALCLALSTLLHAAPPSPEPASTANDKVLIGQWWQLGRGESAGWLPEAPPAVLAPRGRWHAVFVVLDDGRYYLPVFDPEARPNPATYREGRLAPADLAYLRELIATAALPAHGPYACRRAFHALRGPNQRLVIADRILEWPSHCEASPLPARALHLARVAGSLIGAGLAQFTRPSDVLFALRSDSFLRPGPKLEASDVLVIARDGRWRMGDKSGVLSPAALSQLADRIRDTHLEIVHHKYHCMAVATARLSLDLGPAGQLQWVGPCGDSPSPEVHDLIRFATEIVTNR